MPVTDVLFLERILRKTRVVLTDGEELVTAAPAALLEADEEAVSAVYFAESGARLDLGWPESSCAATRATGRIFRTSPP